MYKRITIRIVAELADNLSTIAQKRGLSFNSLVSEMAWDFVRNWNMKYSDATNPTKTK